MVPIAQHTFLERSCCEQPKLKLTRIAKYCFVYQALQKHRFIFYR